MLVPHVGHGCERDAALTARLVALGVGCPALRALHSSLCLEAMTVTMASFPGSVGDTGHEALQRHWLDDALSPLEQRVRAQPVGNRIGFDG